MMRVYLSLLSNAVILLDVDTKDSTVLHTGQHLASLLGPARQWRPNLMAILKMASSG